MKSSVLIADDHELMREGIRALLVRSGNYDVLSEVSDGEEALACIETDKPDFAIIDAVMPMKSGIEVLEAGSILSAETHFIVLSMFDHAHLITEAAKAGASACISKNDAAEDLIEGLEAAKNGSRFFVSNSLEKEWEKIQSIDPYTPLSVREQEVMGEIVAGLITKEIAEKLNLSARTVDRHRERLMRKIGARNAADVVRYAASRGGVK